MKSRLLFIIIIAAYLLKHSKYTHTPKKKKSEKCFFCTEWCPDMPAFECAVNYLMRLLLASGYIEGREGGVD
jgi:hypothetical protein